VIPEVAVRHWVLSLPYRVQVLCAFDVDGERWRDRNRAFE
jgi:hypothetical protein